MLARQRRVCYLGHIFDWQIKLYLFIPEFNFMSDKHEKRETKKSQTFFPLLRRIPERKKKVLKSPWGECYFDMMFGHRTWTGKIYKFIFISFCVVFFPFEKRVLSHHSILWFLIYSLKEFNPKRGERERNSISNLNITHEAKQQQKILWSTNIALVRTLFEARGGKRDGTLVEVKSFIKLLFRSRRRLWNNIQDSINSFDRDLNDFHCKNLQMKNFVVK